MYGGIRVLPNLNKDNKNDDPGDQGEDTKKKDGEISKNVNK